MVRWAPLFAFFVAAGQAKEPFIDRTPGSGVSTTLKNSATPEKHQIETMAGGVALFDYDGDGKLDLYFANGARQPALDKPDPSWHNRLYRNLGGWKFEDVTAKAGVAGSGFHFGVAAGDYDNDGDVDLYVTGIPRSHLYRNRGDGTFDDVTAEAGAGNRQQWPIAAGWFDYNNDGWLDLFVVNYVRWNPADEPFCGDGIHRKYRTYCHPKFYSGLPNTLLQGKADGTFTDVSTQTGIAGHIGKGMGVAFGDYDNDGDTDVAVTNDTVPNFLFRNDRGRFTEIGVQAGIAFNDDGRALSSMGVDFRDADNDGKDDLFITALNNETFPFYRNLGRGSFLDATYSSRIGAATLPWSGWSNAILDFNNDGRKDLFTANGDVQDNTELFSSRASRQQCAVLWNRDNRTFDPVSFGSPALHRGAGFGDLDGNGTIDAVVSRLNEAPVLLANVAPPGNWIALRLHGTKSNRDGLGARVRLVAGSVEQWNHTTAALGYASSSSPVVHFGLGLAVSAGSIEIRWPSGTIQKMTDMAGNRVIDVKEI